MLPEEKDFRFIRSEERGAEGKIANGRVEHVPHVMNRHSAINNLNLKTFRTICNIGHAQIRPKIEQILKKTYVSEQKGPDFDAD